MATDYTFKQGDEQAPFNVQLLGPNYQPVDLSYIDPDTISVRLIMRSLTATAPMLDAPMTVVDAPTGVLVYYMTAADTANAGSFMAEVQVSGTVIATSQRAVATFPTSGYYSVTISENLTTPGGASIVSLTDVKDYLRIIPQDHSQDEKLMRFITAITPVVEFITGPILVRQYDERYDGGQYWITLRHRPVVSVQAVTEWRGPIPFTLGLVSDPAHGGIYTVEVENELARIVRRTSGGGVVAFPNMPQAVQAIYTAGFLTVPENVRLGGLELIAHAFRNTQQGTRFGGPIGTPDDMEPGAPVLGFFVPNSVREMLQPNRRPPVVL